MSCPLCANPSVKDYRPFCSRRCADIDLAKWMNGSYAVPSTDPDDALDAFDAIESDETAPAKPH